MSERQRGLGRGLSALLGEDVGDSGTAGGLALTGVSTVPIESVKPNPDQPRKLFAKSDLEDLASSIRDKGVLQPILVRAQPGEPGVWQIIAGERRWRAAQLARLREVPVIVREMDDVDVMEVAIIENVQRTDLNPVEEANAYAVLMERFGRTQDALAGIVGKSRSHVANSLRLLQLPKSVLDHVVEQRLSAGHARALITARNPEALADEVIAKALNVRQTEALARRSQQPDPARKGGGRSSEHDAARADITALQGDLADLIGMGVSIHDRGGKGDLVIHYANVEQLDDVCRRLTRA